jgi:hypothetical protein
VLKGGEKSTEMVYGGTPPWNCRSDGKHCGTDCGQIKTAERMRVSYMLVCLWRVLMSCVAVGWDGMEWEGSEGLTAGVLITGPSVDWARMRFSEPSRTAKRECILESSSVM